MATNSAVRKLHNDLAKMHKAQSAEKKAEAAEKKAVADEKSALAGIKSQESSIIDQFVSGTAATDAAQKQKLLGQLFTLGESYVKTQDKFASSIAKGQQTAAKEKKAAKAEHKQALKDLKPAEYHLSLKDTNAARKQLGLKALKKPVRGTSVNGINVTPTMRRLATDAVAVAKSMGGYTSLGLCATGVCRTVDRAMGFYPGGNGNTIGNGLLASGKFKEIHIPLAEALKIPGLILSWQHTSTPEGRIYGHTAVTLGNGKESASDFIEYDTLSAARSRSGLKIFMPVA